MSDKKELLPISKVEMYIDEEGNIITPKYMIGEPRDYRLHMGTGTLTLANGEQVTKPKESFKVIPIAVRGMEGKLFVKNAERETAQVKKWMEVYFINEKKQLGLFMFHGFSYSNLSQRAKELFYDDKKLTEVVWTVLIDSKTNPAGQNFCIADFVFMDIPAEDLATVKAVYDNIIDKYYHIYREDTKFEKTIYEENFSNGTIKTKKELEAEKQREQALLGEFLTPQEKEELTLKAVEELKEDSKPAAAKKTGKKKAATAA